MSFKTGTTASTAPSWAQIERVRELLREADAVVVGAGSGLSASAGLTYAGPRFEAHFGDFIAKYHYGDMYTAGFYPYPTPEEFWAYWSRHIYWNRYDQPVGEPYPKLLDLLRDKDYFVLTTNVDHCFQLAGFDRRRLFYTQGDYGLFQCSRPCCQRTYDNEDAVRRMVAEQAGLRVPPALVPRCPVCGAPMSVNLRCDDTFVQDEGWYAAQERYADFLRRHREGRVLYLELGVGGNTPVIIKYPFWRLTLENPRAAYVAVNLEDAPVPPRIAAQSLVLRGDIGAVLSAVAR